MQITVESLSSIKKKITFEIPAERVASEIDKVYAAIGKRAAVKGFRKGKVPKSLIEKQYSDVMEQDVVKNLVNDSYFKALDDEKIHAVSYPEIENEELKKGEPFRYTATVEIFPEVAAPDYDGLEVQKETYRFDEQVIDRRIQEMRESLAQLGPADADHAAVSGDYVTFDFAGSIDGVPFEGGAAEDFQLELGSGRFIPGFEDQMVGLKAHDQREVKVTFPEQYGKLELAGKDAVFAVTVKEIKVKELPALDDDFAKEAGEYDSLADLRTKLAQDFEKHEKERIESEFRDRIVEGLIKKNHFEVPQALVSQQLDLMLENTKKRLAYQRLSLEMMGLDDRGYKVQFRPVAESQVKGSLLLEALVKDQKFDATEEDVEKKFGEIAGDSEQSLEAVKKYYLQNAKAKENLMAQIREDKAIQFLIERAKVVEVSRDELKK